MSDTLFVFGTPEGGMSDVADFLQKKGYTVVGSPDTHLSPLWDFVSFGEKTKSGLLGPGANELLKRVCFTEDRIPDKAVYIDPYIGMHFGYGFKMFSFLLNNLPKAKLIFCHMNLDTNLSRLMAVNKKWIPSYGSCPSDSERKMKTQITQFEEFSSFFPKQTLNFNVRTDSMEAVAKFIQ